MRFLLLLPFTLLLLSQAPEPSRKEDEVHSLSEPPLVQWQIIDSSDMLLLHFMKRQAEANYGKHDAVFIAPAAKLEPRLFSTRSALLLLFLILSLLTAALIPVFASRAKQDIEEKSS